VTVTPPVCFQLTLCSVEPSVVFTVAFAVTVPPGEAAVTVVVTVTGSAARALIANVIAMRTKRQVNSPLP
jgi:hypothetical protein